MTARWLITGAGGMVGSALCAALESRGLEFTALPKSALDITDRNAVEETFRRTRPWVIANCAGYTRVDAAESDERAASAVNGPAVELLASAANTTGAVLIHLSSDFVFDGRKRTPYEIDDSPSPISAYGRSKLLGERAAAQSREHVILRASWLFGPHGPNFVDAIRRQIVQGTTPLRVVNDQRGCPTWAPHLAEAVIRIVEAGGRGILHYADQPQCSWYDFARAIVEELGAGVEVVPVSTAEFPRPATRPAYSVLSTASYEALTGARPASWREGLREYLEGSRFEVQGKSEKT